MEPAPPSALSVQTRVEPVESRRGLHPGHPGTGSLPLRGALAPEWSRWESRREDSPRPQPSGRAGAEWLQWAQGSTSAHCEGRGAQGHGNPASPLSCSTVPQDATESVLLLGMRHELTTVPGSVLGGGCG